MKSEKAWIWYGVWYGMVWDWYGAILLLPSSTTEDLAYSVFLIIHKIS